MDTGRACGRMLWRWTPKWTAYFYFPQNQRLRPFDCCVNFLSRGDESTASMGWATRAWRYSLHRQHRWAASANVRGSCEKRRWWDWQLKGVLLDEQQATKILEWNKIRANAYLFVRDLIRSDRFSCLMMYLNDTKCEYWVSRMETMAMK